MGGGGLYSRWTRFAGGGEEGEYKLSPVCKNLVEGRLRRRRNGLFSLLSSTDGVANNFIDVDKILLIYNYFLELTTLKSIKW